MKWAKFNFQIRFFKNERVFSLIASSQTHSGSLRIIHLCPLRWNCPLSLSLLCWKVFIHCCSLVALTRQLFFLWTKLSVIFQRYKTTPYVFRCSVETKGRWQARVKLNAITKEYLKKNHIKELWKKDGIFRCLIVLFLDSILRMH